MKKRKQIDRFLGGYARAQCRKIGDGEFDQGFREALWIRLSLGYYKIFDLIINWMF